MKSSFNNDYYSSVSSKRISQWAEVDSVQSYGLQKPGIVLRVFLETVSFAEDMKQSRMFMFIHHLPEFRVRGNVAFMNIGTDLAGPLFTRYILKDTSFFKVWIAICTCSLSGAVHLKPVENSTTEQFFGAFRRFFSR